MSLDFEKVVSHYQRINLVFLFRFNGVHVKTDLKVEHVPLRRIKTNKQRTALQNTLQCWRKISCTRMLSTNKGVIYPKHGKP